MPPAIRSLIQVVGMVLFVLATLMAVAVTFEGTADESRRSALFGVGGIVAVVLATKGGRWGELAGAAILVLSIAGFLSLLAAVY